VNTLNSVWLVFLLVLAFGLPFCGSCAETGDNYYKILKIKKAAYDKATNSPSEKMEAGLAYADWLNFEKQNAVQLLNKELLELSIANDSLSYPRVVYQSALSKYNIQQYKEALQEVWHGMEYGIKHKDTTESYINLGILGAKCKLSLNIHNNAVADAKEMKRKARLFGLLYQEGRAARVAAISFGMTGNLKGTLKLFNEALILAIKANDKPYENLIKAEIGAIYSRNRHREPLAQYNKGKELLMEAYQFFRSNEYKEKLPSLYEEIGTWYLQNKEFEKAISYLDSSLQSNRQENHKLIWATAMIEKAIALSELGKVDKALGILDSVKVFTKNNNYNQITVRSLRIKYQLLAKQKRYEEAYLAAREFIEENSILSGIKKGLNDTDYDQNLNNYMLKNQLKMADIQVKQSNAQKYFILVLVFVFAVGATVLFFLQLKLRKVNKELKENTIVVNELNSKLSASDNTKNKLFRIISHDLKGPLSANLLAIRLISDTIESGDTAMIKKLTLMLTKSNTAVLEMLDTLLNWSAMQIDESKTYFDNINLKGLVEMIKRQFADQLVVKEIKIKFEIDSTITFISDSNLLLIVLRNLVSNAIKFSPRGSTIVVASGIIDGKPSIAIVDQGIGMPQELIDKIFTMDASKNRQGTDGEITNGYGMMMIKDMTDKLGIHIEIQSEVNKGATFKLVFPLEATANNLETVKASPLDGMLK